MLPAGKTKLPLGTMDCQLLCWSAVEASTCVGHPHMDVLASSLLDPAPKKAQPHWLGVLQLTEQTLGSSRTLPPSSMLGTAA